MSAPKSSLPGRSLIAAVRAYQLLLSYWLGPACRFEPSCSAYAIEALKHHGALRGTYLSVRRLLRCHPLARSGIDPVPAPHNSCNHRPLI